MKRILVLVTCFLPVLATSSCSNEASYEVADVQGHSVLTPGVPTDTLHYFTTSSEGGHSTVWRADLTAPPSPTGTLSRKRVGGVSHAAGYAPRGAISADLRMAWTTLPSDRRHNDPAQLWLDGTLVDDRVLYLQDPLFLSNDLFYLRREPGPFRRSPQGSLLQPLDEFILVRVTPSGASQVIHSESALWFHFVGVAPDRSQHLLIQRIRDDGSHLLELSVSGELLRTHFLGTGPVRDIRTDPARPGWVTYLRGSGVPDEAQVLELNLRAPSSIGERVLQSGLQDHASPLPLESGELLLTEEGLEPDFFYALPISEVTPGNVLWREHRSNQLTYALRRNDGSTLRLVPPDDAGQSVSLLRPAQ